MIQVKEATDQIVVIDNNQKEHTYFHESIFNRLRVDLVDLAKMYTEGENCREKMQEIYKKVLTKRT